MSLLINKKLVDLDSRLRSIPITMHNSVPTKAPLKGYVHHNDFPRGESCLAVQFLGFSSIVTQNYSTDKTKRNKSGRVILPHPQNGHLSQMKLRFKLELYNCNIKSHWALIPVNCLRRQVKINQAATKASFSGTLP